MTSPRKSFPGERLFKAYRKGLLRKSNGHPQALHATFPKCTQQTLMARLSLRDRLRLRQIFRCCGRGLGAVREKRYEDAQRIFDEGREFLESSDPTPVSTEARLIGASFLLSGGAYLDYVTGDLVEARHKVYTALDADVTLEEEHGYDLFQMHRLQALLNLMRIELQEGHCQEAFELSGQVVAYLEGQQDRIGVHRSWRPETFRGLPRSFPRIMLVEMVEEVARAFSDSERTGHWSVFAQAAHLDEYSAAPRPLHPRIRDWIVLKDAYLGGRDAEYLERLPEFLARGMEDIRGIWYASLVDLLDFCQRSNDEVARFTARALLKDSVKWPRVPTALRGRLEQMREGSFPSDAVGS